MESAVPELLSLWCCGIVDVPSPGSARQYFSTYLCRGGKEGCLLSTPVISLQLCAGTPWECQVGTSLMRTSQHPASGLSPQLPSMDGEYRTLL